MRRIPRVEITEDKRLANERWDEFIKTLTIQNFDRQQVVYLIQTMNIIDRKLIKENKRESLG